MGYLQNLGVRSGAITTPDQIRRYQRTLYNINDGSNPPYALLQETGVADAATRAAVLWFQQQTNIVRARSNPPGTRLTEDGLFGPNTNAALEALAPRYGTRPIPNRVAVMDPVNVPVTPAPPAPRPPQQTQTQPPQQTQPPAGTPAAEIVHGQAGGIQYQQNLPPAGMSTAKKVALVLLAGAVIGGVVYAAQSSSRSRRGSRG